MALQGLGMLSMLEGENPRARACFEEAQAIFREVCDAEEFAWASDNLGQVLRRTGELAAAETCHAQSLAAFSEIGHESGIALTIPMLADTRLDRANPQAARDLLEPHIARLRERGDAKSAFFTWALALLGEATVTLGDFEAGERVLSECVALCKERSFTNQIAYCEEYLGRLWTERRDFERAKRHFRTSLQLQRNLSDPWALIRRIERAAVLFAECQREQVAAALLGTASTVRESLKMPRVPACSLPFERVMRLLRERLSPEELRRAWEEGEKRSLSETLELALAQLE
jgi:tetratricopeptide (TPR) repeat protein